ncbi:MAG: hypothetical protein V3W41_10615 [Planctomycetota bacterium]
MHDLKFQFDRQFLRNGLRRDHLWKGLILVGSLFVILALGLSIGIFGDEANRSGLAWSLVLLICAAAAAARWLRFKRAVDHTYALWLRQSPSQTIRFRAGTDRLTVHLDSGEQSYAWSDLKQLWRHSDVWLFEIVRDVSVLFPPHAAADAMKDFILERCRENGVRT